LPDASWRDRFDQFVERVHALHRPARVALGVIAALVVASVAAVVLWPASAGPAPESSLPRASAAPPESMASAPVSLLVVQAAGAVAKPGLYRLVPGSRVDDLVQAAGGLAADADPDRINLAAPLSDGQKVYVPRTGEQVPADADTGRPAGSSPSAAPLDLNAATVAQLDALPGVGPATAQAIVDYRAQHGRFRSVDDLLGVRGIGPAKLDQIRPLVRV
jgi:competence protein ComEA